MTLHVSVARDRSIVERPENSHNRIWPDLEPIATIDPGENIELEFATAWTGSCRRVVTPPR